MNRRDLVTSTAISGALCLLCGVSALAQSSTVAVRNVTVVDVTDGSLHQNQTVRIDGNEIDAVGRANEVRVPRDAQVVEGEGKYLIPGLWDMHVHAATDIRVESFLRLFLANGITGFRDMFGSLDVAERARASVEAGELPGPPRIVVAGNIVDGPPGSWPGVVVASTPEDGRRIVDSLHAAGAPFIKVYFLLAPGTYYAISERSRELSLPFVGHVPFLVRAADASDAGQRSIEHLTGVLGGCSSDEKAVLAASRRLTGEMGAGNRAAATKNSMEPVRLAVATQDDDRCRRLMDQFIENQTWQVPTLVSLRGKAYLRELAAAGDPRTRYFTPPSRWTADGPYGFPFTEEQWDILQGEYERQKEVVGMMADVGVPLLAGSDTAIPWAFPGFGLHDELELLVEAGLTPLQALQAATLEPARFFGRTDELGTVTEGKLADLVLLDANPLEDISNTQRIPAVVADGRLYRRSDLDRLLDEAEELNRQAEKQE